MKKIILLLAVVFGTNMTVMAQSSSKTTGNKMDQAFLDKQTDGMYAKFETSKGDIYTTLEFKKTPLTVANFVGLVEGKIPNKVKATGTPFYDGLLFHRVIPNFMIQGGCPLGNGTGDPGYKFADEFDPTLKHSGPGILSMANSGPTTNGSQFFITHVATPWLDGKHSIFGHVVEGQAIVDSIAMNDTLKKLTILRKGNEALAFDGAKTFVDEQANAAKKEADKLAKLQELALNAKKEYKTETASGLRYNVLVQGTGSKPLATNTVKVHYIGALVDGTIFDSSVQRGQPVEFPLNRVIPGWTEGVQLMNVGSKYKFFIPYQLAYGERGYPGVIPAKSDLIFEVELLSITPDAAVGK